MYSKIKSINILGVTGSVGLCAVDVIASAPEKFEVHYVTAFSNVNALVAQAIKLKAKCAVIGDKKYFADLKEGLSGTNIKAEAGQEALLAAASTSVDCTLVAIVGMAGLKPTLAAIRNSKLVAIANKEPLVAAGPLVMREAERSGAKILPVDSEHNAIFQVFDFDRPEGIRKIILTASGGPFRTWTREQMSKATREQALIHPNWSMGPKITVDSATMMNKALEIIEAHYLFNMPPEKIDVLVHPQSVVHSMVEYKDGSVLAQMGASDMRTPVAHALGWPDRIETPGQTLDWKKMKELTFEQPDFDRFPALGFAYDSLKAGVSSCVALNAANEVAVESFLNKTIGFVDIMEVVGYTLSHSSRERIDTIDDFTAYDGVARRIASAYIDTLNKQKIRI